jgi:3-hydroxyacyl-CoA dehydrogenase
VRTISRVGVVGAGIMGAGIAEVCARAGLDVLVTEMDAEALVAGQDRVATSLRRAVRAGKLTEADREKSIGAIRFTTDLAEFADRELVVEAVTERAEVKFSVLAALDTIIAAREVIFASNTSSIPIMKLAMATSRAPQVIGIHFFNPAPVLSLSAARDPPEADAAVVAGTRESVRTLNPTSWSATRSPAFAERPRRPGGVIPRATATMLRWLLGNHHRRRR